MLLGFFLTLPFHGEQFKKCIYSFTFYIVNDMQVQSPSETWGLESCRKKLSYLEKFCLCFVIMLPYWWIYSSHGFPNWTVPSGSGNTEPNRPRTVMVWSWKTVWTLDQIKKVPNWTEMVWFGPYRTETVQFSPVRIQFGLDIVARGFNMTRNLKGSQFF